MLPAHIAENIQKQVLFYLQSTFAFRDSKVEKAFSRFIEDPETGLFKGPWIQLRRPFRPALAESVMPFDITIPFRPFQHQYLAWRRLSSKAKKPQATIVTTGTGSGKTECFLYPLLDHCLRARKAGQKGIKAIVLYPMNALAADQEKRFAKDVQEIEELKQSGIRVGNYTGRYDPAEPGAAHASGFTEMGKVGSTWHGITNHAEQLENPPDILLTNYKMLDFLLMRPQDQPLWRFNEPEVLQYLVLDEREALERDFAEMKHADDPNILTCTSTLEMGIDIGDLSSTMLCSVPPNTASYLQRIGRAGRSTGTALIVSFVNQKPHDLFFYARPMEMLKGRVEPPGCWLDASAVLVRQYLGYCFDSATCEKILPSLPKTGKQLVDDMATGDGVIPKMMRWVASNEQQLQNSFLQRFTAEVVQEDTRERFFQETDTELLLQRIYKAVNEFDRLRKDLENAKTRLKNQLKELGEEEVEARKEIENELKIIKGRTNSLSRTGALEILTDHGLLPNYAFPERGVRFYGAIYNKHQDGKQEHKPIELTRPAGAALRELAPSNVFYTHSRQFTIQQIAIGNVQQPIIERWGICGRCGHMRKVEDINTPGASPNCPQCGYGAEGSDSQLDQGQQKQFLEYSQSQALSFMEHYESLSGDKNEERQREFYRVITCFDHTIEAPIGAVGNDDLPFGIEYRASMIRRDVNVGYLGNSGGVVFGPEDEAPEVGFAVCADCGIVVPPDTKHEEMVQEHRRSCQGRKKYEKLRQQGKSSNPFKWEHLYLYRQLRSEAIRLLLPLIDSEDVNTLIACIYLGLRLKFEGNPAHLVIAPQVLPDPNTGLEKHYLILMDAVPGGTGYLKTLYQEKDAASGLEAEGIMKVLRLALNALETCQCRRLPLHHGVDDTDGCYRCLRSYHLQHKAEQISRNRGIALLRQLIEAGEKRVRQVSLEVIKPDSLFGSVLEKKVIDSLKAFVTAEKGKWETTIIKGGKGFRFSVPGSERIWEVELQPSLGIAQGVMVTSQPDFLLSCDDDDIKPVAIFADGFEFHCYPHNRLADDMRKRRAIVESGKYHVWNVTWEDLVTDKPEHIMVCPQQLAGLLQQFVGNAKGMVLPGAGRVIRNGMEQLKAFIQKPVASGWKVLADFMMTFPLNMLCGSRRVNLHELNQAVDIWRTTVSSA